METPPYFPPHLVARTERIKKIWIAEHERKRVRSPLIVIPSIIAYSLGFLSGAAGHTWGVWLFTLVCYVGSFYFIRYVRDSWKI